MSIAEYKTVYAGSAAELDTAVNRLLAEGYQPYGPPYISELRVEDAIGDIMMFQAMTRDGETKQAA